MPNQDYQRISEIIHFLNDNHESQPDLNMLSQQFGISPHHLQRTFKRWVGISPKRFLQYLTAEHAKSRLARCRNLLDAAYDSGLSSPSRLHDLFVNLHAMTPAEYKAKGKDTHIDWGVSNSPFGDCLIGITGKGVCWLSFLQPLTQAQSLTEMQRQWPLSSIAEDHNAVKKVAGKIFACTQDAKKNIDLLIKGTNFQIQVWQALLKIPDGELVTYQDIGRLIDKPKAARAVGSAVGHNAISYLIPCHRVIRNTGIVGQYRWGNDRKQAMLGWEAARAHRDEAGAGVV